MSRLGRIFYRESPGGQFLAGAGGEASREYSEHTACAIDAEVRKIIDDATDEVRLILQERRTALQAVAQHLMEKEVIDGAELRAFIKEHDPRPHLVPGTLVPVEDRLHGTTTHAVVVPEPLAEAEG
jgi:cell division protease FtsH